MAKNQTLRLLISMRLCKKFLIGSCVFVFTLLNVYSLHADVGVKNQRGVLSISMQDATLPQIFKELEKQTDYDFVYVNNDLDHTGRKSVEMQQVELEDVLKQCLKNTGLDFEMSNTTVIIKRVPMPQPKVEYITVKGVVKDEDGNTMPGVNVILLENSTGVISDAEGKYIIKIPSDLKGTLEFTFIGFEKQRFTIGEQRTINVIMRTDINELDDVVVTGMFERKKESFTGAITSVKGEELKAVGNLNVLESLKTIDPSFVIVENNTLGSNPNRIPDIEVRGKTSISTDNLKDEFDNNPNQPLFILDGFETSIQTVLDLDMNRVASITILKDASSTALYGAKAANGVIVVETVKPKPGKLRIMYNADLRVEMPDLTDYNLMNAEQKLEYERLAGLWTAQDINAYDQKRYDEQYYAILAEVRRGVDTYWLNEPLRVGTTLGHSLYADGGDEAFTYGVGINYRDLIGVMEGSNRKTWGTNVDLTYRKNKVNVSNRLRINGYDANESPYGSFSNFAKANPYFRKTDEDGKVTKFLDINNYWRTKFANPLYNGTLNGEQGTNNLQITNNLQAIITFNPKFRLQSGLQISKGITTAETFLPPEHTNFANADYKERGSYTNTRTDNFNYRLNVMATYAQTFRDKHRITTNIRGEVEETSFKRLGVKAIGFPLGTNGNPAYAFSYQPDSRPSTSQSVYRRVNLLGSANYSFDNTYFLDGTYRIDGSTSFGSNEKYSPFWSVGAGVNLQNVFNINERTMSRLKLRGNVGSVGNQSFGNLSSVTIYGFEQYTNVFGQAVTVNTLANPDLQWQNTMTTSVGLDMTLFDNRVNATFNAYAKRTDPLIVKIDLPSSTGVYAYPINAGFMDTRGVETIVKVSPIYKPKENIIWTLGLTASALENEYGGFGNMLASLNSQERKNASLIRYQDGYSPDDMWAVESLGIDPGSGREVFLNKDNIPTYEYDTDDIKVMGNSRPKVEGVISSSLRLRNLSVGLNLRYKLGGDVFNAALFEKVENISEGDRGYNQDLRALTDRWINPGDVAQFKGIQEFSSTPMSSRFIQRENVLIGESINVGYDFRNAAWVKKVGLTQLRANAYMNDIFRLSTVKAERGINYPFAKTVSFSLSAGF